MVYKWEGYKFNLPAQTVGEKLEEITQRYGAVTNKNFVEESRPEDSTTHSLFEWNDSIAAEKWRLDQARRIIGAVKIVVQNPSTETSKETYSVRAYVNKEVDDSRTQAAYVPFEHAMHNKGGDYRDIVVANAKRELREFANKYRIYSEFAKVIVAIEELENE